MRSLKQNKEEKKTLGPIPKTINNPKIAQIEGQSEKVSALNPTTNENEKIEALESIGNPIIKNIGVSEAVP